MHREFGREGSSAIGGHSLGKEARITEAYTGAADRPLQALVRRHTLATRELGGGLRIVAFVPYAFVEQDLLGERVAAYGDTMPRLAYVAHRLIERLAPCCSPL